MSSTKSLIILLLLLTTSVLPVQMNLKSIYNQEKQELVEKISELITENYVFPDLGKKYGKEILSQYDSGKFTAITDAKTFGDSVTNILQTLMNDKHVGFRLIEASDLNENKFGSLHHPVRYFRLGQAEHLGISRLDWIEKEIGYLNYTRFYTQNEAKQMLINAIQFLSTANAIIIDLRENQGGSGDFIPLLCSYFLPYPTPLTGTYYSKENITLDSRTYKEIEGKRLLEVPLFILISNKTFSAAEYLSYNLKVTKRAALIGEPTKGGAHSVDWFQVGERFEIYIPTARAINPITGTNWEGKGIMPDVQVTSDSALDTAIVLAKKAAIEYGKTKDEKIKEIVNIMQRQLDETELLFNKGNEDIAGILLDSTFQILSHTDMLNEWFIRVLAYHYSSLNAKEMATGILEKMIKYFPNTPSAYKSLAWTYFNQGNNTLALKYFRQAAELNPEDNDAVIMIKKLQEFK